MDVNRKWKFVAVMLLLFCLAVSTVSAAGSQESTEDEGKSYSFDIANALSSSHTHSKALAYFAERLQELTDGRAVAKVFNDGQLGNERVAMEQLQMGATAITRTGAAVLTGVVPEIELFGLPYLFEDVTDMHKELEGELGEYLSAQMRQNGLVVLGWFDYGARSILGQKPVRKPEDLLGVRIRVQSSPIEAESFKAFGAAPVNLPFGDLYSALSSGVIDAVENGPDTLYDQRFYEVAPVFSETKHFIQPTPLYISAEIYDELPSDIQDAVRQAGKDAVAFIKENQPAAVEKGIADLEAAGTEIVTDVDIEAFRSTAGPLYSDFYKKYPDLTPIIKAILNN